MDEKQIEKGLAALKKDWGGVYQDRKHPGLLRAEYDELAGIMVGRHAQIVAVIINAALTRGSV